MRLDLPKIGILGKILVRRAHVGPFKYYIFPFIAHAMGTLSGCLIALLLVRTYATWVVYTIGFLFFTGGIMAVYMINAPLWFDILDLSLAYIPMAWLATKSKLAKTA